MGPPRSLLLYLWLMSAGVEAQNTLYSDGGCRIGERSASGEGVDVSCDCGHRLLQTSSSPPINHLDISGCPSLDASMGPKVVVGFLPPAGLNQPNYALINVRSVNISSGYFRLLPVANSAAAVDHPLRRLHIEYVDLESGLRDGALRGLPQLRHVSLLQVQITTFAQNALSDLPRLRSLVIADSIVTFVNSGMMTRVPRLRRLAVTKTKMQFVRGGAIDVEPAVGSVDDVDDDDDEDDEQDFTCPGSEADTGGLVSEPVLGVPTLYLANNSFVTLSRGAFRFSSVQHVIITGNEIGEISLGAFTVNLRPVCSAVAPLFQFTNNDISIEPKKDAIVVFSNASSSSSSSGGASPARARLVVGGNTFQRAALSPRYLRVQGAFIPPSHSATSPVNPSYFSCSCCACDSTMELLDMAVNGTSELSRALFVEPLKTARCAGAENDTFLAFANGCHPGVAAALGGGGGKDGGSGGGGSGHSGGTGGAAGMVARTVPLVAVMLAGTAATLSA